jgi:hypothetical protein
MTNFPFKDFKGENKETNVLLNINFNKTEY